MADLRKLAEDTYEKMRLKSFYSPEPILRVLQASRTATLLESAAAMCEGCREEWPLDVVADKHIKPATIITRKRIVPCAAGPIRRLLDAEVR